LSSFFFVSTSSSSSWVKAFFESTVDLVFFGGSWGFSQIWQHYTRSSWTNGLVTTKCMQF
jgi:hypothetical protein